MINKNLPKIFINPINHEINNSQRTFKSEIDKKEEAINVTEKINNILNSNQVCQKVILSIDNKLYEKKIIGKNSKYLYTIENESILIDTIKDIEKK